MTHNQRVMARLQGLPVDNDNEDEETRQQRRGVKPPDATRSNTVLSFAAFEMTVKVALLTNNRTFSDNLLGVSSSKTIDAVAAKILEDKIFAWLLQDKEEYNSDGFLVPSSSGNKGGGSGFAPTSSLVNESSGNLCATNVDNDYDDNNGGGFMVASSPVNEVVGNDSNDGGGGGFALTSSCRKASLRNSRGRTANKEMGGDDDDDEGGGIVMAASPADANGNGGLPSTAPSLKKEGDCGGFVA